MSMAASLKSELLDVRYQALFLQLRRPFSRQLLRQDLCTEKTEHEADRSDSNLDSICTHRQVLSMSDAASFGGMSESSRYQLLELLPKLEAANPTESPATAAILEARCRGCATRRALLLYSYTSLTVEQLNRGSSLTMVSCYPQGEWQLKFVGGPSPGLLNSPLREAALLLYAGALLIPPTSLPSCPPGTSHPSHFPPVLTRLPLRPSRRLLPRRLRLDRHRSPPQGFHPAGGPPRENRPSRAPLRGDGQGQHHGQARVR